MLKNTTVASGEWEGMRRNEKGEWDSWYHGYYEGKGTPQGASYLYWVDSKRDSAAFESFLGAMPGALSCGWERTRIRLLMIRMAGNHISSGAGARRLLM